MFLNKFILHAVREKSGLKIQNQEVPSLIRFTCKKFWVFIRGQTVILIIEPRPRQGLTRSGHEVLPTPLPLPAPSSSTSNNFGFISQCLVSS